MSEVRKVESGRERPQLGLDGRCRTERVRRNPTVRKRDLSSQTKSLFQPRRSREFQRRMAAFNAPHKAGSVATALVAALSEHGRTKRIFVPLASNMVIKTEPGRRSLGSTDRLESGHGRRAQFQR
jgi:hypothetical protein